MKVRNTSLEFVEAKNFPQVAWTSVWLISYSRSFATRFVLLTDLRYWSPEAHFITLL